MKMSQTKINIFIFYLLMIMLFSFFLWLIYFSYCTVIEGIKIKDYFQIFSGIFLGIPPITYISILVFKENSKITLFLGYFLFFLIFITLLFLIISFTLLLFYLPFSNDDLEFDIGFVILPSVTIKFFIIIIDCFLMYLYYNILPSIWKFLKQKIKIKTNPKS